MPLYIFIKYGQLIGTEVLRLKRMEYILNVDAYSNEDIRDFLSDEQVLLGERSFKDQDYEQALLHFEEANHLRSPDDNGSIAAWIGKCNIKLGIDVEVPSPSASTASAADVNVDKGCSRQSGFEALEKERHSRSLVQGYDQDRRESSSTSSTSSRGSRRREHSTRRRQRRSTVQRHLSDFNRNSTRNQSHTALWEAKSQQRVFNLPDPWITRPVDYFERSNPRWYNEERHVPTWNQEW